MKIPRALLRPAATLFGALSALRLRLYQARVFKVSRAPLPAISVGNLSVGGTGKTPFVRWLAGQLERRGRHPIILTRGYGRQSKGTVAVSTGKGLPVPVTESGDEAQVLARALPSVPIVASSSRIRGARHALAQGLPGDLFLLDDGFSHVSIARDVEIVLMDACSPGGDLLPLGRLREPLSSLSRADVIVITKTEQANPARALEICRTHALGIPVFHAQTNVLGIFDREGAEVAPVNLPNGTLIAVSGLARPEAFESTLSSLGIMPEAHLRFPDHAQYGDFRIGKIQKAAEETGATAIITTEKDAVKLESRINLPIFSVAIQMTVVESHFVSEVLALLERGVS